MKQWKLFTARRNKEESVNVVQKDVLEVGKTLSKAKCY